MIAFIIAAAFGIIQMLLLSKILTSATSGRTGRLWWLLLLKLIVYAGAAALLVLKFPQHIIDCACGYAVGLPLSALLYFGYKTVSGKKSDSKGR